MSNKAIYQPKGAAKEYSEWACNFYVGCSNNCSYCYLKKGIGCKILGGSTPTLKKCFKDESHAMKIFESELSFNIVELQKHGLFFSFTTDPMILNQTLRLTQLAIIKCIEYDVPCKILTKRADFVEYLDLCFIGCKNRELLWSKWKNLIAFGFTLTGHDELEPGASINQERIEAMRKLHEAGFKTFASIEPIIDFESSFKMMQQSRRFCDLYKIGLMSGKKYNQSQIKWFVSIVNDQFSASKIYWKDSLLKQAGIDRADLPSNCVSSDFNLFNT